MQEKLVSIGDDSWIEDDQGDRRYQVDRKALRVRETFVLKDLEGNEVATIQERKLRARDTMLVALNSDWRKRRQMALAAQPNGAEEREAAGRRSQDGR